MLADEVNELKTFRVDRMDNVIIPELEPEPLIQPNEGTLDTVPSKSDKTASEETLEELISRLELEFDEPLSYRRRPASIDTDTYMKSIFGMYHGDKVNVTMLFTKEMMDVVIDKFGEEVDVEIVDDDHFRIKVDVAVSPQFYGWIFGLGQNVMIEFPLRVAKEMKDMLKERHKAYREGHSARIYYP